jgi:hypothetical protein
LAADGLSLYFLADGPATSQQVHCFRVRRPAVDRPWGKVESAAALQALSHKPWALRLSADERVLAFAR